MFTSGCCLLEPKGVHPLYFCEVQEAITAKYTAKPEHPNIPRNTLTTISMSL